MIFHDEDVYLTTVLNSRDNGRDRDNRTYLQANRSGYVEFSYQLGLAYYYSVGSSGDKSSAVGWFQNVIDADMDDLDMGENDEYKYAWQAGHRFRTDQRVLQKSDRRYKQSRRTRRFPMRITGTTLCPCSIRMLSVRIM